MDKFEKLRDILNDTELDANKFYRDGVVLAGKRVRKQMKELKKASDDLMKDIMSIIKGEK
jgi:hypothetical protein